jgi:hypothetical protein
LGIPQLAPLDTDLSLWQYAIDVPSIKHAFERHDSSNDVSLDSAPSWVILYLLSCKVHSPLQATAAVNLMLRHFSRAPLPEQITMLILSVRMLARQHVPAPVPKLVKLFLILNLNDPPRQFNLLLRAMSHLRPAPEIAKAMAEVLQAMDARCVSLQARTYRSLLSNNLVTYELAKVLQQRMVRDGVKPNMHQLEAYLRVFARSGAVHSSARYLNLIKLEKERKGHVAPHGADVSKKGVTVQPSMDGQSANTRHNTTFLSTFKHDSDAAFQFLRSMVQNDPPSYHALPKIPRKEKRFGLLPKRSQLNPKRHVSFSDWLPLLSSLAHNRSLSPSAFLHAFSTTQSRAHIPLTIPVVTVLLRGLVKRREYETAATVWRRVVRGVHWRRRCVDAKMLTVVVDALVGSGDALGAFDMLLEATGVISPSSATNDSNSKYKQPSLASRHPHSKPDAPLLNALMRAFLRHGRPEMVFKLWDAYTPLFEVYPDAETLCVVLEAAVDVASETGVNSAFEGMRRVFGFGGGKGEAEPFANRGKEEIVKSLRASIGMQKIPSDSSHPKAYVNKSIWNAQPAAPKALALFHEILLGNYPSLREVEVPAEAVWADPGAGLLDLGVGAGVGAKARMVGLRWIGRDVSSSSSSSSPMTTNAPKLIGPTPSLLSSLSPSPSTLPSSSSSQSERIDPIPLTPLLSSPHPQISPTPRLFTAYISLLGALSLPSRVAPALAWMRHLDLTPPPRGTLAECLAMWSEASMRGPLFESATRAHTHTYRDGNGIGRVGRGGRSEFTRLVRWLEDWVGREGVPTEGEVAAAFGRLRERREA